MDKMILDTINSIDIEMRIKLFGEILLSGGNTSIKGFPETLHKEIKKGINVGSAVIVVAPSLTQHPADERAHAQRQQHAHRETEQRTKSKQAVLQPAQ